MNLFDETQKSPSFCLFSSTTVVPKRALVTFVANVKGMVLKNVLGASPRNPLSSLAVALTYS